MRVGELYQLGRRLQDVAERAMGSGPALDLTPAERIVVVDLLDHGTSTISRVSSRTGFAQSRVSTVVAALRERGWIETSVSEADRRHTHVALAEDGRRRATEARTKVATPALTAALAGMSADRRGEVLAALEEVHRALAPPGAAITATRPRRRG
ncbi:MAG TPA: MarR family winged helix-turn-helix transcriptional regulator [Candidatus Dormibacteraeota bacterium]